MNLPTLKTAALIVVAGCFAGTDAQACGELMLRTLDTMRYHSFVTRHPAAILLYAGDALGKNPADIAKLHDSLERAGHKVALARGADELKQALAARRYDVVIADSNDLVAVSTQFAKTSKEPILIPLLSRGADERQVRERFPRVVSGGFNDLLKTIEQSMKTTEP